MRNLLALLLLPPMCATAQLPDYVPTDGLVGWWPFEGSALDASGNGNHGLVDGDPALLPSFVYDSVLDRDVIQFDDIDDELTIPAPNQLGLNNEFSFACWLTPNEENHGQVMSMDNGRFSFFLDGANDHFDALSTTSWASEAYYCGWDNYPCTHPDGWFHMTITISSDSIKAYGNGELITALDCGGQSNFDTNLIFGFRNMNSSGDYHWGGSLANCGVWNRPLTDLEVESLFDQTSPISGCTDPTACNYDDTANANDGTCEYGCLYCGEGTVWDSTLQECVTDLTFPTAPCGEGTVWDPVNEECIIAIPADLNYDGCVTVNDLLVLLAVHGTCPPYPEWPDEPTDTTWTCGDAVTYWGYDYATVLIGDQCWFAENLRTTVYGNGDLIPAGLSDGEWTSTTAGATAVYGEGNIGCNNFSPDIDACDETQSLAQYGRLYNWYAVDDTRGLCPSGWHVPTDGQWTELEDYITSQGFAGTEGTALKSSTGWRDNGNGMDNFGFAAFPAGYRVLDGNFADAGGNCDWWCSSSDGENIWFRYLDYLSPTIYRTSNSPHYGFSVRCIKD